MSVNDTEMSVLRPVLVVDLSMPSQTERNGDIRGILKGVWHDDDQLDSLSLFTKLSLRYE